MPKKPKNQAGSYRNCDRPSSSSSGSDSPHLSKEVEDELARYMIHKEERHRLTQFCKEYLEKTNEAK